MQKYVMLTCSCRIFKSSKDSIMASASEIVKLQSELRSLQKQKGEVDYKLRQIDNREKGGSGMKRPHSGPVPPANKRPREGIREERREPIDRYILTLCTVLLSHRLVYCRRFVNGV